MSDNSADFEKLEEKSAHNFVNIVKQTHAKQIINLGGTGRSVVGIYNLLVIAETQLKSPHKLPQITT